MHMLNTYQAGTHSEITGNSTFDEFQEQLVRQAAACHVYVAAIRAGKWPATATALARQLADLEDQGCQRNDKGAQAHATDRAAWLRIQPLLQSYFAQRDSVRLALYSRIGL